MDAEAAAREFQESETEFHLGFLPTEQAHPATAHLAELAGSDLPAACDLLLAVDADLMAPASRALTSKACRELESMLAKAIARGGRVILSGCGATGRLCLLLESAWREACGKEANLARYKDVVRGIMTGGDYAFIRSVESFEDYAAFGARQIEELQVGPSDCVVGISEGGETSSVLGSIEKACELGAAAGFVCNNPHALLRDRIERSRRVLDNPKVVALEIDSGPMALSGSTRMQATTSELLVMGGLLEQLLGMLAGGPKPSLTRDALEPFRRLVEELRAPESLASLARWIARESSCYSQGGAVTYFANSALIDILTDTTERTPTFALPPFQPADRQDAARPWAMVKGLEGDTMDAWQAMLGRLPVCLRWTSHDYAYMKADPRLVASPPHIDKDDLAAFHIGAEPDASRHQKGADLAVLLLCGADSEKEAGLSKLFAASSKEFKHLLKVGMAGGKADFGGEVVPVVCGCLRSRFRLWEHLALKLAFNTVSTITMARLGRVTRNWMTHVQPTNKKLIDRACRIICDCTGITYEKACSALFQELQKSTIPLAERPSPVESIISRLTHVGSGGAPR